MHIRLLDNSSYLWVGIIRFSAIFRPNFALSLFYFLPVHFLCILLMLVPSGDTNHRIFNFSLLLFLVWTLGIQMPSYVVMVDDNVVLQVGTLLWITPTSVNV